MKRSSIVLVALATLIYLAAVPAFAQRGGSGGGMGGGMGAGRVGNMGNNGNSGNVGVPQTGPRNGRGDRGQTDRPGSQGQASRIDAKKSPDQMLQQHPQLESRLASLLPAGTDIQQAAGGFKNLGQFVAAVHVSHNLGIPFDQLKARMTGQPPASLGQAIHDLKPEANAKSEAKRAEQETRQDLSGADTGKTGSDRTDNDKN